MNETTLSDRVNWRLVGSYYGVALSGAVLVAGALWLLRLGVGEGINLIGVAVIAVFYMPLPLVAGLVTERVAGRRPLIAREWGALRRSFWRTYGRNALAAVVVILAILALGFATAWLAGVLGVPGAGHLVSGATEFQEHVRQMVPGASASVVLPAPVVLAVAGIVMGVLAGLTVNGLFAFGEDVRLARRARRPAASARARARHGADWCAVGSVARSDHHAGVQLRRRVGLGGIIAMVAWTLPLSFLLTALRERTGSVLAPSFLHGAYNGVSGAVHVPRRRRERLRRAADGGADGVLPRCAGCGGVAAPGVHPPLERQRDRRGRSSDGPGALTERRTQVFVSGGG